MPRLFVALDIPDPIKDQLAPLQDADAFSDARWTKRPTWHLTLHFIGEADIAPIDAALSTVEAEVFHLRLDGVGTFPKRGRPRVLWAGIHAPEALYRLHTAIGEALQSTGYTPESRPYHPHITLARFKGRPPKRDAVDTYVAAHADLTSEPFAIEQFTLYESERTPQGAVYTPRGRYALHVENND